MGRHRRKDEQRQVHQTQRAQEDHFDRSAHVAALTQVAPRKPAFDRLQQGQHLLGER
jgi:hypothetical protein